VAEYQSPLFQIVGRYDTSRHAIPGQGFDPIPFHGGVGDELTSIVELNTVTGVGQYLGY
jgi:hypothetical protein